MEALAGKIPGGLPNLGVPRLSRKGIVQLISAAFVIALVASITKSSVAHTFSAP